jgi:type VI secretion system protein ImpH
VLGEFIRFDNRVSLAFPPSQIESLRVDADTTVDSGAEMLQSLQAEALRHISITPAFMGFLGSSGVLPSHYTERIGNHEHDQGDAGPREFLDIFSTGSLRLFYRAMGKHRPQFMVDENDEDRYLAILLSLAGFRPTPPADNKIADEVLASYAAQFRSRAVPASVIAGVLAEYFGVPVELEQLIGTWEQIPAAHQAQVGVANDELAIGVLLGERIYRRDSRARLRIGPLQKDEFNDFLPEADAALALKQILCQFCGAGVAFEIRLVLKKDDVVGARLAGNEGLPEARLGLDAFLLGGHVPSDREDVSYLLQP